jgi:hypothetical protein
VKEKDFSSPKGEHCLNFEKTFTIKGKSLHEFRKEILGSPVWEFSKRHVEVATTNRNSKIGVKFYEEGEI